MKNYIGYVNDHSGSMEPLRHAAAADYNANIEATKNAATREMLDTIVSVVGVGVPNGAQTTRQVVVSNPHVLKPITNWPTNGGTPLWDGISDMVALLKSVPDYNSPDVSFLVIITTDGEEMHSKMTTKAGLANIIESLQRTGRWTFVFRVPKGKRYTLTGLGVPDGNIQEWETTAAGMAASTAATTAAMDNYYTTRAAGQKSSTVFYADAKSVNVKALKELDPKEFSLYVVPNQDNGIEIQPFVLKHRMQYLKGAAFYQLTKTEARITPKKLVAVRDRSTGKVFTGPEARQMIGLSTTQNARLHPGDHGNYDIFIQSESINRKLVGGTGLLYWPAVGTAFTQEDLAKFAPKPAAPAIVQLPAVPVTNKPTPSPIPVAKYHASPAVNGFSVRGFFLTREHARVFARGNGGTPRQLGKLDLDVGNPDGFKWYVA